MISVAVHQRPSQLKCDHQEKEQDSEDFACSPLSEPSFDPGEDGTGENDVDQGKCGQHQGDPENRCWFSNGDPDKDTDEPQAAQRSCDIECAKGKNDQKICAITQRESQK